MRSRRGARPRPLRLGRPDRCPALKTAADDLRELAGRHAVPGRPVHLRLQRARPTRPTTRTGRSPRCRPRPAPTPVNAWINGLTAGRHARTGTAGIFQVAAERQRSSTSRWSSPTATRPPTATPRGPGNHTRFREVENGIFSANGVKAEGTRVRRLRRRRRRQRPAAAEPALPSPGPTAEQRLLPDHRLRRRPATSLRALALGSCTGSVTVVKQVVPSTAPPGTIDRRRCRPAAGRSRATTATSGRDDRPDQRARRRPAPVRSTSTSPSPAAPPRRRSRVTETQQAGLHPRQQVGGFNAVLHAALDTDAARPGHQRRERLGFIVPAATSRTAVSCTVYNRAPNPPATDRRRQAVGHRQRPYDPTPNGAQPPGLPAAADPSAAPPSRSGVARTGFTAGQHGRHRRDGHQSACAVHARQPRRSRWPTAPPRRTSALPLHRHPGRGDEHLHDHQRR